MHTKNSYCSFCGAAFNRNLPWPRDCSTCGIRSYLNPLPVVVALVPVGNGLVVVRRNIEPQKGTLTLPGGYLDCGETWQGGMRRELLEETGIKVPVYDFKLYEVASGLDNTVVILGLSVQQPISSLVPYSSDETEEVLLIDGALELGFPLHTEIVKRYFVERE